MRSYHGCLRQSGFTPCPGEGQMRLCPKPARQCQLFFIFFLCCFSFAFRKIFSSRRPCLSLSPRVTEVRQTTSFLEPNSFRKKTLVNVHSQSSDSTSIVDSVCDTNLLLVPSQIVRTPSRLLSIMFLCLTLGSFPPCTASGQTIGCETKELVLLGGPVLVRFI